MPIMGDGTLLDFLTKDWDRLKQQKCKTHGGVEGRTLLNVAMVEGEHDADYRSKQLFIEAQEENRLYLKFNVLGRRFDKLLGRLTAMEGEYVVQPDRQDPKAKSLAEAAEKVDRALDQRLDQHARQWELLYWLGIGGTAFVHTPWIPNATTEPIPQFDEMGNLLFRHLTSDQILPETDVSTLIQSGQAVQEMFEIYEEIEQAGEVGCEILGPLSVFIDQNVRSVKDLAPDQWIYIAEIRTTGWIEDNFGVQIDGDKDLSIISSRFVQSTDSTGGHYLADLVPLVQGTVADDDPAMNVVVHGYLPTSKKNPRGKYVCFVPKKAILLEGGLPYEDLEIPIVDFHWKPVTTSFWTADYITDLIPPQRFLNRRVSQLGEQSNASLYSMVLLGGSLTEKDIIPDKPSVVVHGLTAEGVPLVQRLNPPELGSWFLPSIELVMKLFNDISGGGDLLNENKFPGQLRGPLAVPMLQEIMDTEWGPLYNHIGERWAKVKQQRLNRVKQFYPPVRTMHYTNRDQKDEVLIFHKEKVMRSGTNFNISVKRGSLLPELRSLREDRLLRRLGSPLALLYMDERSGRYDKSKIAEELKYGDIGRESRDAQYRKLGQEVVEMLWTTQPVPPVLPFYDHPVMMDELESAMATTEFLRSSPPIQQAFSQRWEQHRQFMAQQAQAQQQALQSQFSSNAIAQATQQAAAEAAAGAIKNAQEQNDIHQGMLQNGQTAELVRMATAQNPPRLPVRQHRPEFQQ